MKKEIISFWLTKEHEQLIRGSILPKFQETYPHIEVLLSTTDWQYLWDKVLMFSRKKQGPDVFQFGNTWNGALAHLGALLEVSSFVEKAGGLKLFVPMSTKLCFFPYSQRISSVPWYIDVRAYYYRYDLLSKYHLEPRAISTLDDLEKTFRVVQEKKSDGSEIWAFGIGGQKDPQLVHNIAPWIWSFGGDFIHQNGKEVIFHQGAALSGIEKYFQFVREFCPHEEIVQSCDELIANFAKHGKYAFIYLGPWINDTYLNPNNQLYSTYASFIQSMPVPAGPAGRFTFMGGSNLGISAYTRHPEAAWTFVNFLLRKDIQEIFCSTNNQLPSLAEGYSRSSVAVASNNRTFLESVRYGRVFPNCICWARIEDILVNTLNFLLRAIQKGTYTDDGARLEIQNAADTCNAILRKEEFPS